MVTVAAYATGPAILLSMLPMLAIALSYQRCNLWRQNCGGPYVWVGRAIHPYAGYMVAWSMLVAFVLGAVSNILPLGPALLSFLGLNASGVVGNVVTATLFGLAMTALAAIGLKTTARFQLLIAGVEYLILVVFSVIGFVAVFVTHRSGTVRPTMAWLHLGGVGGKGSLAGSMLIGVFLFLGWDNSIYIGEETKGKRTNPGRAALISVALLGPLYLWIFISLQGVLSLDRLNANAANALPAIATALVGSGWAKFMILAVVLSVLGTTQATIVAISRVTYSMGTDGLLPRLFGTVHERFGTPFRATVFWGVLTVVVADLYVGSSSISSGFNVIVNAAGIAATIFFLFTGLATAVYYRRLVLRSVTDFALVGLFPLCGSAVLGWMLYRSVPGLDTKARTTVICIGVLGLVLMVISKGIVRAPFFSTPREAYLPTGDRQPSS
jgi:amino acid transporter